MEDEAQINKVIAYQAMRLGEITPIDLDAVEARITSTEDLLQELGYELPSPPASTPTPCKRPTYIPQWEELCEIANRALGAEIDIQDLFTDEEIHENSLAIRRLNAEYRQVHKLDDLEIAIAAGAGLLAGAADILLVGIPEKNTGKVQVGPLSDYIRDAFEKAFPPPEEVEALAKSKTSKVSYDAQDNRNTTMHVEGLSSHYHRLLSMGHDPILGLVFGTIDILNGTMTTIDKSGKFNSQVMECYADRTETSLFSALAKQITHFESDVTTPMGLPVPAMCLFNLFQYGSIGEKEQTIAEIVQGMYHNGYDFIHFCSMSASSMLVEVAVRTGYAIKRINEGLPVERAIPMTSHHKDMPKLATMLFIAHSAAAAINAGKIYFSKNPLAISYSQWMAFADYSYHQLKWVLLTKPAQQDKYVHDAISAELDQAYRDIDSLFEAIAF